jgi:large subunit ribosomal protein L13
MGSYKDVLGRSCSMKTYSLKPADIEKKWYIVDAANLVMGRTAAQIANRLRGKHKPTFTPHMDGGDYVVVINAEKIALTGNKRADERFYWHTGYVGGIKNRTFAQILDGKYPERLLQKAVQRMLPKGPLGRKVLGHLKVYAGTEHPHAAQNPESWDIAGLNRKNSRSAS